MGIQPNNLEHLATANNLIYGQNYVMLRIIDNSYRLY